MAGRTVGPHGDGLIVWWSESAALSMLQNGQQQQHQQICQTSWLPQMLEQHQQRGVSGRDGSCSGSCSGPHMSTHHVNIHSRGRQQRLARQCSIWGGVRRCTALITERPMGTSSHSISSVIQGLGVELTGWRSLEVRGNRMRELAEECIRLHLGLWKGSWAV